MQETLRPPLFYPVVLILLGSISGCHVVSKARECKSLSVIFNKAVPTLTTLVIKENPEASLLQKKATIYSQLSLSLKKAKLESPGLREKLATITSKLDVIEAGLKEASTLIGPSTQSERKNGADQPIKNAHRPTTLRGEVRRDGRARRGALMHKKYLQVKGRIEAESQAVDHLMRQLNKTCQ